jgi:hypothetical protein
MAPTSTASAAPVRAIALLGWMDERSAVDLMTELSAQPGRLSRETARKVWLRYRRAVGYLRGSSPCEAAAVALTTAEERVAGEFLRRNASAVRTGEIRGVAKLDPRPLVVHQLCVVAEHAARYAHAGAAEDLGAMRGGDLQLEAAQLKVRHRINEIVACVPHAEFGFAYRGDCGQFRIVELPGFASVTSIGDRTVLWTGYHRAYARVAAARQASRAPTMLFAITTDGQRALAWGAGPPGFAGLVSAPRPPVLSDYFDPSLSAGLLLARRAYELEIRARVRAVPV